MSLCSWITNKLILIKSRIREFILYATIVGLAFPQTFSSRYKTLQQLLHQELYDLHLYLSEKQNHLYEILKHV